MAYQRADQSENEPLTETDTNNQEDLQKLSQEDYDSKFKKSMKMEDVHNCCDVFKWYKQDPCGRLPFMFFFIAILSCPILIIYYVIDPSQAYVIAGLVGLCITIYGCNQFRLLLQLKEEVTQFYANNQSFRAENRELQMEVARFKTATENLGGVRNKICESNKKQREYCSKFRLIQKNMKDVNLDTVAGMKVVRETAEAINRRWEDKLLDEQRRILWKIFDRVEMSDDSPGMNKSEFDEFCKLVPNEYSERFVRLGTFKKLAGKNDIIKHADFALILDIFAKMFVEDCDMDFVIENVEVKDDEPQLHGYEHSAKLKSTLHGLKPQVQSIISDRDSHNDDDLGGGRRFRKQVTITKRSQSGQHFTLADIDFAIAEEEKEMEKLRIMMQEDDQENDYT